MGKITSGQEKEVIIVGSTNLVTEESSACRDECFFYNFKFCEDTRKLLGGCKPQERKDGKRVIFKQVY